MTRRIALTILTGQAGSGKSTAKRALEDNGFFCVDNIPVNLVEPLVSLLENNSEETHLGLVMDLRESHFTDGLPNLLDNLRGNGYKVRVAYFEATEEFLVRRFSETRRPHPLDEGGGLRDAIRREHDLLVPLRELADETVDTSGLSPHQLRDLVSQQFSSQEDEDPLQVEVLSFGFKYGLPLGSNLIFDVRFLSNPYFVPELRKRTGMEQIVRDHVLNAEGCDELLEHLSSMLDFLVPQYRAEGKRYLTVAIGCTGGQHRSVSIAHELHHRLGASGLRCKLRHRDVEGVHK